MSINYNIAVAGGWNVTLASKGVSPFTNKRYLITDCANSGVCFPGSLYSYTKGAGGPLVFEHYMSIYPEMEAFPLPNGSANYTKMACVGAILAADLCAYTGAHSVMAQGAAGHQY